VKTLKKVLAVLSATLMMLTASPVLAVSPDIVDTAVAAGNFTTLVAALQAAGLDDDLKGAGPFTVFAPTDAAFAALLDDLDITAAQLLAHPQLADVLKYHVIGSQVLSTDLSDGMTAATLQGENITVDLDGGVKINDATVTTADIMASNGVIHVIDKVLVPASFVLGPTKSIVEIAAGNPDFSILVAALQKADLVGALSGAGPFTVFAPTNAAFEALLSGLGITAEQLLNHPQLADVLKYHVLGAKVMSTDLSDGMTAATLQGESITVDLGDGVMINQSKVTTADLEATNGVIHVIDKVLVPAAFVLDTENPETADSTPYLAFALLFAAAVVLSFPILRKSFQKN
jgi:uncharacterized surface protein with fasciclin (FAS1) repeats